MYKISVSSKLIEQFVQLKYLGFNLGMIKNDILKDKLHIPLFMWHIKEYINK
jgi:hypothetical protein